MSNKLAQGLPVNIIVMMIIGIILFGLGLGLFSKIAGSGEETIEDLNDRIKDNINSLECQNTNEWICSPPSDVNNGDRGTFEIFIANKGNLNKKFRVELNLTTVGNNRGITNKCGSIIVSYPSKEINILSGTSASIPYAVIASRVSQQDCSFITTATLYDDSNTIVSKTPIIIRVN